jgi:thiol:disulfide interchange protein DsbD
MAASSATASRSTPTWVFAANKLYNPSYAQQVLEGHGLLYTLGIFFVLGMALSLLPCTLPMIPIVSAIVLGDLDQADSHVTRRRGFILSLSYVLGMALVYTGLGVAAALLGQSLGAWLQNPWVLGVFAILLVLFAISMLGAYELQLPQAWQSRIHGVSQRHSGGKLVAVFAMGAISALVVGACMTAPLFGVLAFIAHTGNAVFGAAALFALGLGLGVPLLIVGTGAGVLLPRAGAWMESVKRLLGVLLLAVAIWIISPVIPIWLTMLLIALLLLLCAAMLWRTDLPEQSLPAHGRAYVACMFSRALGILAALAAAILLVGIAAGSRDPFRPLAVLTRMNTLAQPNKPELIFTHVKTSAQLDQILDTAHRPVLLDFYADWCVSCKEMEKFTFADPRVQARLAQMNLLRANVTDNDANDRELLKRFKLFGPPAIIVFDASGQERLRIIGYQPASTFLHSLDQING